MFPSVTKKQLRDREENRNRYPLSVILFLNADCVPATYCEPLGEEILAREGFPCCQGCTGNAEQDGMEEDARLVYLESCMVEKSKTRSLQLATRLSSP